MTFVVSHVFLILSLFLNRPCFFYISVNSSGLFLLYVERCDKWLGMFVARYFGGFHSLFIGIFLIIPYLLVWPDIPPVAGLRVILLGEISLEGSPMGDLGSIPGCVIQMTLKMVLETSLLNTQHYKVRIKGKVEESKERSSALPYISV